MRPKKPYHIFLVTCFVPCQKFWLISSYLMQTKCIEMDDQEILPMDWNVFYFFSVVLYTDDYILMMINFITFNAV